MGKRRQKQRLTPAPPSRLAESLETYTTFYLHVVVELVIGQCERKTPNYIFHSGLDQRKQTGGVIVALLKIRAKKKKKEKKKKTALGIISVFSTGHFLNHVTVVLLVCASKCGQSFGRSCKHGNILLVWIKAEH